jgi:hypothetical protein
VEECRSQVFGWRIVRFEAARPRPSWIEACRFSLTPISDLIPQNPCRRSDSLPCRLACRACNTPTARLTVMMWRHHYCSHDCMIAAHSSVFAPRTRMACRVQTKEAGEAGLQTRIRTNTKHTTQPSVGAPSVSIAPSTSDPFIRCTCFCVGQTDIQPEA